MKKLLSIMLVILLVLSVSGCGLLDKAKDGLDQIGDVIDDIDDRTDDDDNDNDDNDNNGDNDDDKTQGLFAKEVFYPADFFEVLNEFDEFGYVWTSITSDGATNSWSFYYRTEGREEVGGVDAEVVNVVKVENEETKNFSLWFDDEWNCVKAMQDEEDKEVFEGSLLTMLTQLYVNHVLLTKVVIKEDASIDSFTHTFKGESREGFNLGQEHVSITKYELLGNFNDTTYTYGLTNIDGKLTYVLINHAAGAASEEMRITHMKLR